MEVSHGAAWCFTGFSPCHPPTFRTVGVHTEGVKQSSAGGPALFLELLTACALISVQRDESRLPGTGPPSPAPDPGRAPAHPPPPPPSPIETFSPVWSIGSPQSLSSPAILLLLSVGKTRNESSSAWFCAGAETKKKGKMQEKSRVAGGNRGSSGGRSLAPRPARPYQRRTIGQAVGSSR